MYKLGRYYQFVRFNGKLITMATNTVGKTFTLNSGYCIPTIGLGTSRITEDEMDYVIKTALNVGYRHFDSAYSYSNHSELGNVLSKVLSSGQIKREEIFVTSKLGIHANRPEDVRESMNECLDNLKLDYVDLFLIHLPTGVKREAKLHAYADYHLYLDPTTDYLGTWKEMEKLVHSGLTKSIGVSNFNKKQLSDILQICTIKPAINQTECHPYLQEKELLQFCKENNIILEAYGALGSPSINDFYKDAFGCDFSQNEVIVNIAKRHTRSVAQILLRYQLQRGIVVLPKSSNLERLKENIDIFDFSLSSSEMDDISNLDRAKRIFHYDYARLHPHYPW